MNQDEKLQAYMAERPRLFRLAYRYLETVGEAEDVLQEAWIRFARAAAVESAPKLLSTIVTRLALDRLKQASRRRETYVGPWLPEPLVGDDGSGEADTALDISYAVMRCLELLSPAERAAFFLHDIYDVPYAEIAGIIGRPAATCRKIAERARKALAAQKPRFEPDDREISQLEAAFDAMRRNGDEAPMRALLAEQVEFVSDGGGKVIAALNVVRGREAVARLLAGLMKKLAGQEMALEPARVNGEAGFLLFVDGQLDQTIALRLDDDRRVAGLYVVRNPDKLAGIGPAQPA